jgi:hypothetical protein
VTQLSKDAWTDDPGFVPRVVATDGQILAVAGGSNKIVLLDLTDPSRPAFVTTLVATGSISDIAISKGWLYALGSRLDTFRLSDPAERGAVDFLPAHLPRALTVSGDSIFVAAGSTLRPTRGLVLTVNVADPLAPALTGAEEVFPSTAAVAELLGIFTLDANHVVALSRSAGNDVVVLDQRGRELEVQSVLDLAEFTAFRGALLNDRLYVIDEPGTKLAIVDLSDPAAPRELGRVNLGAPGAAVFPADTLALLASGESGVTTVDCRVPETPSGGQGFALAGPARDVVAVSSFAYAANEIGVAVVPMELPPLINVARVAMLPGSGTTSITGSVRAVTGRPPLSIRITNQRTSQVTAASAAADGSFVANVSSQPGDGLTIAATDGAAIETLSYPLGQAPFAVETPFPMKAATIPNWPFSARTLAYGASRLAVNSQADQGGSNALLLFDVGDPAAPVLTRTLTIDSPYEMAFAGASLYIAARDLHFLDTTAASPLVTDVRPGRELGLVISGRYAFTSPDSQADGRIRIYDLAPPAGPQFIREQGGLNAAEFWGLVPFGSDYLIGLTPDDVRGEGDDVVVIDRRDINNLVRVGSISIDSLAAYRGVVVGQVLYVTGWFGGFAAVDLSNPGSPVVRAAVATPGLARDVSLISPTLLAVADSTSGVTLVDLTSPFAPVVKATQWTASKVWDVVAGNGVLYVANESTVVALHAAGFEAPPSLDIRRLTVGSAVAGTATVTGAAGAVSGSPPLSVVLHNLDSGASSAAAPANSDGSFVVSVSAAQGQHLALSVTDGVGRSFGPVSVGVASFEPVVVRTDRISVTRSGPNARVTGTAGAVTGAPPLSVVLRNPGDGTSQNVALQSDGSFDGLIAAATGDAITITVTNGAETVGPLFVGHVPLEADSVIDVATLAGAGFRARSLAVDGTSLAVAGLIDAGTGGSDKLIVLDIASGTPVHRATVTAGQGPINDLVAAGGWAYVASDELSTVDLNNPSQVSISEPTGYPPATAIVVQGTRAFTTHSDGGRLHMVVHDISEPAAPRYYADDRILDQAIVVTDLLALDGGYLLAISPDEVSGAGYDLTVIDARDSALFQTVRTIDIPGFRPFRGRAVGRKVYLASREGRTAIVDFTDIDVETSTAPFTTTGSAFGVDVAGEVAVVAEGARGVEYIDGTGGVLRSTGAAATTQAWDVVVHRAAMYVADDTRVLTFLDPSLPPMIDPSVITIRRDDPDAGVEGSAGAIRGTGALNGWISAGPATSTVAVNSDGRFSGTVPAKPGDAVTAIASDDRSRSAVRNIGRVPFGNTTSSLPTGPDQALGDLEYVSRRIRLSGEHLVASGGVSAFSWWGSDKVLLFTVPDPGATATTSMPRLLQSKALLAPNATATATYRFAVDTLSDDWISDIEISGDRAYVSGRGLAVVNLAGSSPDVTLHPQAHGYSNAIAVQGNHLFLTSSSGGSGSAIFTYDISNPVVPVAVSEAVVVPGVPWLEELEPFGSDYLIGFALSDFGGDVYVIDRRNLSDLRLAKTIDLPDFAPLDLMIDGNFLYLSGNYFIRDAIAIVDLSDLSNPRVLSLFDTPGLATGMAVSGPDEIVVADGAIGVTFVDVADKSRPVILGSQSTPGHAIDVKVVGRTIYVATEQHLHTIIRP